MIENIRKALAVMEDRPTLTVLIAVGAVTFLRLVLLFLYQTSLGPDEAQYWFWGQELDWGYYSKPPVIAWSIALTTGLFGDHVWAVRFLSPLMIGAMALCLYGVGRKLYGDRVAIWAAMLWLFLPAIMLGSTMITTDVPLLLCWSAALFCLVGLAETPKEQGTWWAVGLGAAIGMGFLSKYAMIYFPLGWVIALVLSPYARRTFRPGKIALALLVAAVIFAPNIWWNFANGLQTLSHTADNANWSGQLAHPDELLDFVAGQFGVAGPIIFGAFLFGLFTLRRRLLLDGKGRDLFLLSFILPPLIIICVQAFLSRAHANWAMAAYPAMTVLLPAWFLRREGGKGVWVLRSSLGLHVVIGLFFTAVLLNFSLADAMGMSKSVKRLRGWEQQGAELLQSVQGYDAVITDEREFAAHLNWEWRGKDHPPMMVADLNNRPDNTYEYVFAFEPKTDGNYILLRPWAVGFCWYVGRFETIDLVGTNFIDLHDERRGRPERTIELFEVTGYDPDSLGGCHGRS
ncbi:ArnT family glycosyltransferase [Parvularcula marina]|uniref:Phospholipid carrier-dependent glycosyltransferase n=1 Tax=Parvularcula marina TaxID=2292771 RepID=A0A371RH53_9PROT|nr:glycosyltransferase family 39 protein [Parvularcula marina]RFB04769.1 phospholipid carrier-dependent glycosyltransferase [Parvularcula marina]